MDKKLDNFAFVVRKLADDIDLDIDCAMIAVRDRVSGKAVVMQLDGREEPKRKKKMHSRLHRQHK